ncbi:unnamed protein product, partial [Callosobruchus maculatus]
ERFSTRKISIRPLNIQGLFLSYPFSAISFLRLSPITASASTITLHDCYIAIAFTCLVAT